MLVQLNNKQPHLGGNNYFIADNASIIGDVTLSNNIGVWFGAVIRGDDAAIIINDNSNIQDNCVLHVDLGYKLIIGCDVTIGHSAVIHGCKINDNCIIGMHSTILNGAVIGSNCIIGANSLVTKNTIIPDNSLVLGSPAKIVRTVTDQEIRAIQNSAAHYVLRLNEYKNNSQIISQD